ncbi:transferase [Diaporthe amygdali]|uniref:transferase n=1 Tax=Phomopsis amygdali TaxID=1214568 RepID=UPI0022FE6A17|nr:transferase [Diaporthe amygdali]KAJ0107023.1 transferase [Diaporthe amygdali]
MAPKAPHSRVECRQRVHPATISPAGPTRKKLSVVDATVARWAAFGATWLFNSTETSQDVLLHQDLLKQTLRETLDDYRHFSGELRWATENDVDPSDLQQRYTGRPIITYSASTDPGVELIHASYDQPLSDIVPSVQDRCKNKNAWVNTHFPQNELLPKCKLAFDSSLAEYKDAPGYPTWATASTNATKPENLDQIKLSPSAFPPWPTWDVTAPIEHVQIRFGANEVANMKQAAQAALPHHQRNSPPISRFDALLAHLWILINRARQHQETQEGIYMNITLGLRNRIRPPLPDTFTGSPVLVGHISHRGSDTCSAEDLGTIALSIRNMVSQFTPEAVTAYLHDAAHEVSPQRLWQTFLGHNHVLATSWTRLGVYELDFCGTRPVYVQDSMPRVDGMLQVIDVGEGAKDFDISLSLESDDGYLLFEDAQDMKLAGGAGQNHSSCDLCAIIWWSLRHDWRKRPLNRGHGEFIAGDFNVRVYRNPPRGAGAIQRLDVLVMPPGSSRNFSWSPDQHGSWRIGPLDEKPWLVRSHLTVYSDTSCAENRQTSSETAFKLPEAYSGSPQSLDLVSQWLADCVKRHGSNCSDDDESVLPKHVIEIGDLVQDGTLSTRIITTNGSRGKYLTLSYCWGRGPFFTMTSDNIDELHDSLPVAKLPQTIRDAVSLAKHLGFRYLWVDSLCIIQGGDVLSTADWEEQSQDMDSSSVLETASEISSSWVSLVEEYSRRSLTFMTDKLPAISGLAAVVSHNTGQDFHFGIWQRRAQHMLMWRHVGRTEEQKTVYLRQKTPRAPTWSWASVDGGVEFLKGAVDPARLDLRGKSLIITGRLEKMDTIRYHVEGKYYGEYEKHRPWMKFRTTMKSFLDDLDDIPHSHRKTPPGGPKELVGMWLFFLGQNVGLILAPVEPVALQSKGLSREKINWVYDLFSRTAQSVKTFRRVGAFIGYNTPRGGQNKLKTIEII